jgi:hypothetical protein
VPGCTNFTSPNCELGDGCNIDLNCELVDIGVDDESVDVGGKLFNNEVASGVTDGDGVAADDEVTDGDGVAADDGVAVNCEAADGILAAACSDLFNKEATSGVTVFIALSKLLVISSNPSLFT